MNLQSFYSHWDPHYYYYYYYDDDDDQPFFHEVHNEFHVTTVHPIYSHSSLQYLYSRRLHLRITIHSLQSPVFDRPQSPLEESSYVTSVQESECGHGSTTELVIDHRPIIHSHIKPSTHGVLRHDVGKLTCTCRPAQESGFPEKSQLVMKDSPLTRYFTHTQDRIYSKIPDDRDTRSENLIHTHPSQETRTQQDTSKTELVV